MVKRATVLNVLSVSSFIAGVVMLGVGVVCLRMNNSWGLLCSSLLAVSAITALKALRKSLDTDSG